MQSRMAGRPRTAPTDPSVVRLQKFLSRAGVASRRASEVLIAEGRVRVDGEVVTTPGTTVDPATQRVEVDGREVKVGEGRWIAFNKPPMTMCTREDPGGRLTIYDVLPPEARPLFHVGRLDFMSQGLLLLTNEGGLANRLLHPRGGLPRRYVVTLVGPADPGLPGRLVRGVTLEDGPATAAESAWETSPAGDTPRLSVTLTEGRNREVRRMLAALGVRIRRLERVSFGPIRLGRLPEGASRELTAEERRAIRRIAGEPDD